MALDKIVDSTELDSGLTTVANAIRAKGGTSEQLSFPSGMAQAIAAIPSGGSLPTSISKIDGGSFTLASDTKLNSYQVAHNLGVAPKIFFLWCDDNGTSGGSYPVQTCISGYIIESEVEYGTSHNYAFFNERYRKTNDYTNTINLELSTGQLGQALTANYCVFAWRSTEYYKANCTYKWLAWA